MNEIDYLGVNDLVFHNDIKEGIHSGGFSVKSALMKSGLSPIMTLNTEKVGGSNNVSDLFNDLVIPNWALSYNNKFVGGKYEHDSESEDETIENDLHDKLLDLVREHENKKNVNNTFKNNKKTTKRIKNKTNKVSTKKRKTII
jgi:hypothetical protein